jgi:hypothetical protein
MWMMQWTICFVKSEEFQMTFKGFLRLPLLGSGIDFLWVIVVVGR